MKLVKLIILGTFLGILLTTHIQYNRPTQEREGDISLKYLMVKNKANAEVRDTTIWGPFSPTPFNFPKK
jgi:hypothetical protein